MDDDTGTELKKKLDSLQSRYMKVNTDRAWRRCRLQKCVWNGQDTSYIYNYIYWMTTKIFEREPGDRRSRWRRKHWWIVLRSIFTKKDARDEMWYHNWQTISINAWDRRSHARTTWQLQPYTSWNLPNITESDAKVYQSYAVVNNNNRPNIIIQRLSIGLQRGNAVSFHNTMVTE